MKLLLDTHILLWAAGEPERLPAGVRGRLDDPATELFYSAASLWEVSIKRALGRQDFSVDPRLLRRGLMEHGYRELAVSGAHAVAVDLLPAVHKDPFDRMLVTQAQVEGMILLTSDALVARYPGPIELI